tara:strand:+ start:1894 stop:3066 length:1173 start_codon:yes stop_codon:yes gene_type:complete
MASLLANRAIECAIENGKALIKFISPNDAGATKSHQCGFYLPKGSWELFSPFAPCKGRLDKHKVQILWDNIFSTESVITWYGKGTRSEYRLTSFGKNFPYLNPDSVGSLFVFIPVNEVEFNAFILDRDEDIEEVQAALGVEIANGWGVFSSEGQEESKNTCLTKLFSEFAGSLFEFPSTREFSEQAAVAYRSCVKNFAALTQDDKLLELRDIEYALFRVVEQHLCAGLISEAVKDIDQFLTLASSMLNRRKCRAGASLEHHFEKILNDAGIPFDSQCRRIRGRPDIIIPSEEAYLNPSYPRGKLCVLGVKTTCKDRWRQVLDEAPGVDNRYIVTLQPSISSKQATAMYESGVSLIVPKKLQKTGYKADAMGSLQVFAIESFLDHAKGTFG